MTLKDAVERYNLVKRGSWSGSFAIGKDGAEYRFDEKLNDYVKSEEYAQIRLTDALAEDWGPTRNEAE